MAQLIDKSALVAEIERRKKQNEEWKNSCKGIDSLAASMVIQEDINILSFINTLEVKEVDLEKELVEEVYAHIDSIKDTADRMTSGNFMHNRASIKFSANTIAKVLDLIGLKS